MTINYEVIKDFVSNMRIAELGSYDAEGNWLRKDIYFIFIYPASEVFKSIDKKHAKLFEIGIEEQIKSKWNNYKPEKVEAGIDYVRYVSSDVVKEFASDEFMTIKL